MPGLRFYTNLRTVLQNGNVISNVNDVFVEWAQAPRVHLDGLVYLTPDENDKNIPRQMIIDAYNAHLLGTVIDYPWCLENGQNHYCHPRVLNFLIENFPV